MAAFLWTQFALSILSVWIVARRIAKDDYPRRTEVSASEDVTRLLLTIAFLAWESVLLFGMLK